MSIHARIRRGAPVASLAIASLALVVAMGGTAVAAKKWMAPANSVNSLSIKNGQVKKADLGTCSVTSLKLATGAVTGAKLAAGSVTASAVAANALGGDQIDESKLASVPAAQSLDNYFRVYKRVVASDQTAAGSLAAARAAAPQTVLATYGPFTVYGKCYKWGTDTYAETFAKTSVNGSVLDSDNDDLSGSSSPAYLDTTTAETDANLHSTSTGNNSTNYYLTHSSEFFLGAPTGATAMGEIGEWVKMGTLAAGDGFYGAGNSCHFQGRLVGLS